MQLRTGSWRSSSTVGIIAGGTSAGSADAIGSARFIAARHVVERCSGLLVRHLGGTWLGKVIQLPVQP
jgi:hypothetical protein